MVTRLSTRVKAQPGEMPQANLPKKSPASLICYNCGYVAYFKWKCPSLRSWKACRSHQRNCEGPGWKLSSSDRLDQLLEGPRWNLQMGARPPQLASIQDMAQGWSLILQDELHLIFQRNKKTRLLWHWASQFKRKMSTNLQNISPCLCSIFTALCPFSVPVTPHLTFIEPREQRVKQWIWPTG